MWILPRRFSGKKESKKTMPLLGRLLRKSLAAWATELHLNGCARPPPRGFRKQLATSRGSAVFLLRPWVPWCSPCMGSISMNGACGARKSCVCMGGLHGKQVLALNHGFVKFKMCAVHQHHVVTPSHHIWGSIGTSCKRRQTHVQHMRTGRHHVVLPCWKVTMERIRWTQRSCLFSARRAQLGMGTRNNLSPGLHHVDL